MHQNSIPQFTNLPPLQMRHEVQQAQLIDRSLHILNENDKFRMFSENEEQKHFELNYKINNYKKQNQHKLNCQIGSGLDILSHTVDELKKQVFFSKMVSFADTLIRKENRVVQYGFDNGGSLASKVDKKKILSKWYSSYLESKQVTCNELKANRLYALNWQIKQKMIIHKMRKILLNEGRNIEQIELNIKRKVYLRKYLKQFRLQVTKIDKIQKLIRRNRLRVIMDTIKEQNTLDQSQYFEYYYEKLAYKVLYALKMRNRM